MGRKRNPTGPRKSPWKGWITTGEAVKLYGVSRQTLLRLRRNGTVLPFVPYPSSKIVLYPAAEMEALFRPSRGMEDIVAAGGEP